MDQVRALDLSPRPMAPAPAQQQIPDDRRPVEYFASGAESGVVAASGGSATSAGGGGDGYDLSFDNTPIAGVAKVVLGDILGLGFVVDPRIQGTITLASARPVPRGDLIYVLETALKANNVAMVRDPVGYRLVPANEAPGTGAVDVGSGRPQPGYGVSVVPLRYVSVSALVPLLDSFAVQAGMLRPDPARNVLLIQGTASERQTAVNTALSFDADWMRGQSVGIYPVRNSGPEPVIAELEKLLDSGENGL
ncbi:secretin N-terminal domain-containing protein, partial [Xanthobacter sp. KR7-65]|uniref:secretin N-terminal domain-containing protein n=1 Tax=Xanthobacter sp. KR7-65 TaxID=3156612 RepID=UPI0032B53A57